MLKVSIAIPAYNNAEAVKRLVESIEIQSYKDYEVIITDDSENEAVYEVVKNNPLIHYYKNNKRLGSTGNWNEAVRQCTGDYIKIMHHDDWFTTRDSLGKFVGMLESHPEAEFAFSGTRQSKNEVYFDRFISSDDAKLIEADYRNLFLGNTIGAPSAVIYKKCGVKFDENLKWLVDSEFYMNILKSNPHFVYSCEPLVTIGLSEEQLTEKCIDDKTVNIKEYGYIYNKYNLHLNDEYKNRLFQVLLDNDAHYNTLSQFGMSRSLYFTKKVKKLFSKIKWKIGVRE